MKNQQRVLSREWHFSLSDIQKEHDGKVYTVGICVCEIEGKRLIAVGEVLSRDVKTGKNLDSLICASVYEAVKHVTELGGKEA